MPASAPAFSQTGGLNMADKNNPNTPGQGYSSTQSGQNKPGQSANWDKTWQQNLPEVDRQITDYYNKPGFQENPNTPNEIGTKVKDWFKNKQYDEQTNKEFQNACATPQFQKQVDERIDTLRTQGKIPPKQSKAGSQSF
jgi:hypothetical protein